MDSFCLLFCDSIGILLIVCKLIYLAFQLIISPLLFIKEYVFVFGGWKKKVLVFIITQVDLLKHTRIAFSTTVTANADTVELYDHIDWCFSLFKYEFHMYLSIWVGIRWRQKCLPIFYCRETNALKLNVHICKKLV